VPVIRIILTFVFAAFAIIGIVTFLQGKVPASAIVFSIAYTLTALALNQKAGALAKYAAYFTGFILCLGFLIAVYALIQQMMGNKFELFLFGGGLFMGLIGLETIQQLRNIKKNNLKNKV
jgi:hypothetical protein